MKLASDSHPLLIALRDPATLTELDSSGWQKLLDDARHSGLLAKLAAIADKHGILCQIPAKARTHLDESHFFATHHQTAIRYEVNRLLRALFQFDTPIVLLKGGAYLMAELPPARGRSMSDLDIMVPKDKILSIEEALLAAGWERTKLTDYDEHYFRDWMHEIPAIWHPERRVALDIHHTIVPVTSRYRPNTEALFSAAVPLEDPRLKTLCPADMVLHSAIHLFNEEFLLGLRDLSDLHDLLKYFSRTEGFWDDLLARSRLHGMERILYYLLRYARRLFSTEVPAFIDEKLRAHEPSLIVRAIMDALVMPALRPSVVGQPNRGRSVALFFLRIHSHWLKMPPLLLARHLTTKAMYNWRTGLKSAWDKTETKPN